MRLKLLFILSLLSSLLISHMAHAVSPWMRSGGEAAYSVGLEHSRNDQFWDENSDLQDSSCESENYRIKNRIEYGYSYYHTLIASLGLSHKSCGEDSQTGIGDLRLGIRGRLNPYKNGRTWELTAIIPTGSRTDSNRLGNGVFGIEGGVAILDRGSQRDFAQMWDWEAGASIRLWLGAPSDQLILYTGIQRHIGEHGRLSFGLDGNFSFRNGSEEPTRFIDRTRLSDFDRVSAQVGWSNRLTEKWRYRVKAGHVIWGRNAGHDLSVGISFSYRWFP